MRKKKVRALANSAEFQPQAGSLRWDAIREDYIAQNLMRQKGQPAFTLRKVAEAHNVSYDYLRQVAGTQKWNAALKARVAERKQQAVEAIKSVALYDEIEIRTRHATYARLASSIAYQKLNGLSKSDIEKLSVRDAIELLRVGMAEERTVLGVQGDGEAPPPQNDKQLSDQQVFAVARRVIEMKRGSDGQYSAEDA